MPAPAGNRTRARPRSARRIDVLILVVALVSTFNTLPLSATAAGLDTALPGPGQGVPGVILDGASPLEQGPAPASTRTSTLAPSPAVKSVGVASIEALLDVLADDSVDEIVVANGIYHVSPSNAVAPDSLWIGPRFAARTRPVLVRAETIGGVTFDGGGGHGYGGLSFEDGAHDQTWDGFNFANMDAGLSGIVEIGGYTPRRAPNNITLRNISITRSCTGSATTRSSPAQEHAFYIANALEPGPYNLLFEDIVVDGRGGLASAFHLFHSAEGAPNATNVTVRRLRVTGTQQAIMLWDSTLRDVVFDDVTITGAMTYAIRYESSGSSGIVLSNITSTGSGYAGFYSSEGARPTGLTFRQASLR